MNQPDAKKELQEFCDPKYSGYLGDVMSNAQAVDRAIDGWALALEKAVTPISPAISPAALAGAVAAFKAAAVGMYASGAVFSAAVAAFAVQIGLGMNNPVLNPPLGYTATPPAAIFIPTSASPVHETACDQMAAQLVAWLETGTATDNFTGNTVNWS